jgi:hypothetical protein
MQREFFQDAPQMTFVDRNQKVQAFAPEGSDQAFAECIGEGGQLLRMTTKPIPFLKSSIHTIR